MHTPFCDCSYLLAGVKQSAGVEGGKAPSIPCPFWSELHSMGIAGNKLDTEEIAGTVSFAGLHTGMQVRGKLLARAPLHLYKGQCEGL